MSRYFEPITIDELRTKINKSNIDDFPFVTAKVRKDLQKVNFDTENTTSPDFDIPDWIYAVDETYRIGPAENLIGYHTLDNDFTFLGAASGGDWQIPVFFIIYFDGKVLRGYVPEFGNPWNTDTNTAYGDDEVKDLKNIKKRFDLDLEEVDDFDYPQEGAESLIIIDIKQRITVNTPLPLSISKRIEALKYYGTGDEGIELFRSTCSLCYKMNGIGTEEKVETLYKWAKEQADASLEWANEDPDYFELGCWGCY